MKPFSGGTLKGFPDRIEGFFAGGHIQFRGGTRAGLQAQKASGKDGCDLVESLIGRQSVVGVHGKRSSGGVAHDDLGLAFGAPSGGTELSLFLYLRQGSSK